MKKESKELLRQWFNEYSEKNGYKLSYNMSYTMIYLDILKNKENAETTIEDFLFNYKLNKIDYIDRMYDFMLFVLEKNQKLGLQFMIYKSPTAQSNDYANTVNKYLEILKNHSEELFEYIYRPAFVNNNLNKMDYIFGNYISNQEKREAIIDIYLHSKLLEKIDEEMKVYKLIQKYIDNKEKYEGLFSRLEMKEDIGKPIVATSQVFEVYVLTFNLEDLTKFNPQLNGNDINNGLFILSKLESYYSKLGLEDIILNDWEVNSDNNKIKKLLLVGNNLDKEFLYEFSNIVVKSNLLKIKPPKDIEVQNLSIDEIISTARHNILQKTISTNNKLIIPKKKI